MIFVSSDLSGVKFDAKKVDMLGNFKLFVLGVGCWVLGEGGWGWGGRFVGGGKMHIIRIDLTTELFWVKIKAEKRNC